MGGEIGGCEIPIPHGIVNLAFQPDEQRRKPAEKRPRFDPKDHHRSDPPFCFVLNGRPGLSSPAFRLKLFTGLSRNALVHHAAEISLKPASTFGPPIVAIILLTLT